MSGFVPRLDYGSCITTKIESLTSGGAGYVVLPEGIRLTVPGGLPGDIAQVKIKHQRRKEALGLISRLETPSSDRGQSICAHFPECGGCQLADVPYENQIRLKRTVFDAIICAENPAWLALVRPVIGAIQTEFHRNKMEFSFFSTDGQIRLGLKRRGHFDQCIPTSGCRLLDPALPEIFARVGAWAMQSGFTAYDPNSHEGVLRYLVFRKSHLTQSMLMIVVSAHDISAELAGLSNFLGNDLPIQGIINAVNATQSDTAFCTEWKRISGAGTIGIYCSDHVGQVIGVEENPSSVADAGYNIDLNHCGNVEIRQGKVKNILKFERFHADRVLVDPPRGGLEPKALRRAAGIGAPSMIYVSCNPKTAVRDLTMLAEEGYTPDIIQPVDMFPHTFHLEAVIRLRRF
ncbi:class I SAM-dependent RNA methyltransferase [bacterium]|nr:class I SAM-dependent RNA methyltransferase [bacterium]